MQAQYYFTGREKNPRLSSRIPFRGEGSAFPPLLLAVIPNPPFRVRDLHWHWHWHWHWLLPFLPSEISNLKFEIACAFDFVKVCSLTAWLFPQRI
jgi:hypothetical protein